MKLSIRHLCVLIMVLTAVAAKAQGDTLVTRLHEVSVVGLKQSAATDLSAVTEIGTAELQRLNIVTMKEVSALVPNFYMPNYGSRMTSSIYVRGLGARIDQPVVGLSVDGVPYLNKDNYDFDLFDIRKIEVLRGAQSILNGRNTMAGQVNITTLSPWQYQGVRMMAEYGRANSLKAGVGYYTRINSKLASAVTGYYTHSDGFFRNSYNDCRLDAENQGSLRWKLSWHPSDRLSVSNVASGQISRQGGPPYVELATGIISRNDTSYYRRNTFADGLTVGWTGKRVLVTSVTSLQYIDDDLTLDQDFTAKDYFTLTQARKEWTLTEDLYAKGTRGAVNWLGGVFGFYKHSDMDAPVTFHNDGIANLIEAKPNQVNPSYPLQWDERRFVLGSDFLTLTKGVAVYQQSSYRHGPWKFELGLRFDVEHASLDYHSHCNTSYTTYHVLPDGSKEVYMHSPVKIDDNGRLAHTYAELLPKIAIGYTFDNEVNAYVNLAKGFKAGGFNTQMFSDVLQQRIMEMMGMTKLYDIDEIVSYKPEKSWNAEVGVKAPIKRVNIDATLYYITCVDQQLTAFPPGMTTGRIMTNAGRTRSYGAEFSAQWHPNDIFTARCSYGYTNARFVKYDNGREDYKGKRLPFAPSNTLMLSANCALPYSWRDVTPSLDVNMRGIGDIYWDEANTVHQPFYATLGASVTLTHPHWSLSLWGENITDTKYDTFYFVSVSNAFVQRARPVTYGATLRVNI